MTRADDAVQALKKELPSFAMRYTDNELKWVVNIVINAVCPWEQIGISRSTYYKDMRKAKQSNSSA